MSEKKLGVVEAPVFFNTTYIQSFIDTALKLGHIPAEKEFNYSEKDNSISARIENTTLVALSYSHATNSDQHQPLLDMCSKYIQETFALFKEHGTAIAIFNSCKN